MFSRQCSSLFCQTIGGMVGTVIASIFYFLCAALYDASSNSNSSKANSIDNILNMRYFAPGVSISALLGFFLGVCATHYCNASDDASENRSLLGAHDIETITSDHSSGGGDENWISDGRRSPS